MSIILMTDSTSDLNKEELEKYDIRVLPLYVTFNGVSYKDGVDITTDKLYEMVDELGQLPKTAAISIADFIEAFEPIVKNGDEIIYSGISSKMSSSYNNAIMAARELECEDKIHIVDSLNLSSSIGLIMLEAAKYKEEGKNALEIVELLNEVRNKVVCHFIIDTFDFLYKGGRCSSMSKVFGSLLKIKPMIAVHDGAMIVAQKPIGHKKAINQLIDTILINKDNLNGENVMITHSFAQDDALYIKSILEKEIKTKNIFITNAGSVISSHCGKGTIGILYIKK